MLLIERTSVRSTKPLSIARKSICLKRIHIYVSASYIGVRRFQNVPQKDMTVEGGFGCEEL